MLKKIKRNIARLVSLKPEDPRVIAISKMHFSALQADHNDKKVSLVAVQGVEDPIFFGLFAALISDLREDQPLLAKLIQIRSINGAIGVGIFSKISRSWLFARLMNDQWARVYKNIIGSVAYRSQPFFWNFGRWKDNGEAKQLWSEMKNLEHPESLKFRDIQIGDLVVDSYLRYRPCPSFNVLDPFVLMILQQAVREYRLASKWFKDISPSLYLSSYATYIEHGIPVRVAVSLDVPVWVYGNLIKFGKKLSSKDTFHTVNSKDYRLNFDAFPDDKKNTNSKLAKIELEHRLSGGIDAATSYMKVSAYASANQCAPKTVAGSVVVFLHDFYDSPHVYGDLIFTDFWAWICFTIKTLSDAGIAFWLKPHPNQISLSEGVLVDLIQIFPEVRILSPEISNKVLVEAGMICGVTVYGTVAHELAYFGIPTIACATHPHSSFKFCRTAKSINEYKEMLISPEVLPIGKDDMRNEALAFYYMHNLNMNSEQLELRSAFIKFWTECNARNSDPNMVCNYLVNLKNLPGWSEHVSEIQHEIARSNNYLTKSNF